MTVQSANTAALEVQNHDQQAVDAQSLRRRIREAEALFDETALALGALKIDMLRMRQKADFEVHVGQKALIRLTRAEQYLVDGATDLFRVHDELTRIGQEKGLMDEYGSTKPTGLTDADRVRQVA